MKKLKKFLPILLILTVLAIAYSGKMYIYEDNPALNSEIENIYLEMKLGIGNMLKSIYDTNDDGKVDDSDKVDGKHASELGGVTDHGALTGLGDDDHSTIYLNNTRHDTTTRHPVSVLKLSIGSYSQDIQKNSMGTPFTTNKYAHQIEVKGESNAIRQEAENIITTTSWVTFKYIFYNAHPSYAQYAYARWYYHSASKQAIWGIWDKDEKKLVCVLIEEDEGYCKLYPELKENQKLIKIKNPKKYEKLFAWDIMELSKENKIDEKELEEIKGGK